MSDTIEIKKWVTRGHMIVNTSALNCNDPDHPYNQVIAQGCKPEDYGMEHPLTERFKESSRNDLINKIVELESELQSNAMFKE